MNSRSAFEGIPVELTGDYAPFATSVHTEEIEPGLHLIHFELHSEEEARPCLVKLSWHQPIVDIQATWHPDHILKRALMVPWEPPLDSKVSKNAPVISLYNASGINRHTFACDDALNALELRATVDEVRATFACSVSFFTQPWPAIRSYRATVRVDLRPRPYYETLREVGAWWATLPGTALARVPDIGKMPMYSTWYSFHLDLKAEAVEAQCALAKALGCESIIVDDGWQTPASGGGYAYCGDWQVIPEKIPDMAAHVARVHALGLKYLLWFSVPFIGKHAAARARFEGKYLCERKEWDAFILDPRFPEVREYLVSLYEQAVRDWDLDGFKLDFIDSIDPTEENYRGDLAGTGRDFHSVPEAVDALMREIMARLTKLKPDILVEFRQCYVGPLMRHYGNLFRAADCPNDALANRARTLDIRLLCGGTAVHSDMLMWSPDETPENAALQLLNVLFSVPQISVKLETLPEAHRRMLRFWLGFWRARRDILLDGVLEPRAPELLYPFVLAKGETAWIGALYSDSVATLCDPLPGELWLVNATPRSRIVVEVTADAGLYEVEERNVLGESVEARKHSLAPGLHALKVGPSGLLHLKRIP